MDVERAVERRARGTAAVERSCSRPRRPRLGRHAERWAAGAASERRQLGGNGERRKQAGDPRDADVFARSGWFRGVDGNLKKELPDTGATLVPTGGRNF